MDRVVVIGIEGSAIGKLHHTAKFVPLRARGDVVTDKSFDQPGDLPLKRIDLLDSALLLISGDARLPAKRNV